MEKYTKHYIKYKMADEIANYEVSELESRDVCTIINKYGNDEITFRKNLSGFLESFYVIAFCLYDVHYIEDEGIKYKSNNTNIRWIYFGKRVSIFEYDSLVNRIIGNKKADSFCKIGDYFYALGPDDMVFDEYIDEYYSEYERVNLKLLR